MFDEKINLFINKYISKNKYSKLSIGVIINDKKYYFNYNNNGLTSECYDYEIGSISKTITAHLVMKFVSNGILKLDQPVGFYLGLEGEYPTIYELLTHTSSYRYITPFNFTLKNLPIYYKKNIYHNINNEKVLNALRRRMKKKKKRYNYRYSDFNYAVLGLILEKVSNKRVKDLLDEFIKNDLKMDDTNLLNDYNLNTDAVYKNKVIPRWEWNDDNPYLAAGGISSNVVDMVKYMELELNSKEDYMIECHKVNINIKERKDKVLICPGWHAYKDGKHLWHVGKAGCYQSSIIVSKNKNIGVVGLGNSYGKKEYNINYLVKMIYSYLARNKNKL